MSVQIRDGCGCVVATVSGVSASDWLNHVMYGSAIGEPKETIRIEPVESPVPAKTPAPAPTKTPEPTKEPVGA